MARHLKRRNGGFTLVELVVVVLIIAVLAGIAVPAYFRVVERGRLGEVFSAVSSIKSAEQRYIAKSNVFTGNSTDLDVAAPTMKYFGSLTITATASAYTVSYTRSAPTPGTYGAYVVSYLGPGGTFQCGNVSCQNDLMP